jgi:hypothetical protein
VYDTERHHFRFFRRHHRLFLDLDLNFNVLLVAHHPENTRHLAAKLLDNDVLDSGSRQLLKSGPPLDDILVTARLSVPGNEVE